MPNLSAFSGGTEGEVANFLDKILARENAPFWFVKITDNTTGEVVIWNHRVGRTNKVTKEQIGKAQIEDHFRNVVRINGYQNPVTIEVSGPFTEKIQA